MGFKLNRTYNLVFEGALAGAEVRFKATPVAAVLRIQDANSAEELAALFEEYVIEWNLEDLEGAPLGVEAGSILASMDWPVMEKIALEWLKAAKGITAPLDGPSTSGAPSPEPSIEMATL